MKVIDRLSGASHTLTPLHRAHLLSYHPFQKPLYGWSLLLLIAAANLTAPVRAVTYLDNIMKPLLPRCREAQPASFPPLAHGSVLAGGGGGSFPSVPRVSGYFDALLCAMHVMGGSVLFYLDTVSLCPYTLSMRRALLHFHTWGKTYSFRHMYC